MRHEALAHGLRVLVDVLREALRDRQPDCVRRQNKRAVLRESKMDGAGERVAARLLDHRAFGARPDDHFSSGELAEYFRDGSLTSALRFPGDLIDFECNAHLTILRAVFTS